jgi:hypothetical protein
MVEGVKYHGQRVKYTIGRGQYTMGREFDIPWIGEAKYHG